MATVIPFKAVIYNPARVKALSKVVAPPYDVISPGEQEEFYERHPCNIIRLILGRELPGDDKKNNKYKRAGNYLREWMKEGILQEDREAALYVYEQDYLHGAKRYKRCGFIALMKIEAPHKRVVLPHEHIMPKPRLDRFLLMKEVKANLSPVFTVFPDTRARIDSILKSCIRNKTPFIDIEFGGCRHRLWRITQPQTQKKIIECIQNKKVYIADGHHRYEAAMDLCNLMRKRRGAAGYEGSDYIMTYFVSSDDRGLTILPTHRVIKKLGHLKAADLRERLAKFFAIHAYSSAERLLRELDSHREKTGVFGMYLGGARFYLLNLKDPKILDRIIDKRLSVHLRRLDVVILHNLVFDRVMGLTPTPDRNNVVYTNDASLAMRLVQEGKGEIAFFLNPTKIGQVKRIASMNEKMPEKSTYFYPKLLSGLLINKFNRRESRGAIRKA